MCCWCKVTGYGTNNSANGIITQHGHNSGGGGITMKYVSDTDYRMSINTGDGTNRTYMTYYSTTNIYNDWHHLCLTYDRSASKYRMYIDGKLETIVGYGTSITYGDNAVARPFRLFDWSTDHSGNASYRPPCYLNDVRLYDHCLSAKEIQQISQGLVAHYKLSAGGTNNLLTNTNNPANTTGLAGVPSTCSIIYDNILEQNVFQSSTTATSETYIYSSRSPVVSQSTQYTFSCDVWVNDYVKSIETFWLSDTEASPQTGTGYAGSSHVTNKSQTIPVRNEWFHLTWTFTTKSDDRTGYIRFDNNGSSTSGTAAIVKITNLKLEKGATETTYNPGASETVFTVGDDSSGYNHHGTVNGTIELAATTGRNERSAVFAGAQSIACGRHAMVRDAITVNWWGYMDDWSLYGSAPMRAISCTEGGGWNFEPSSSKMCFVLGTGASSNTYKTVVDTTTFANYTAGWHMFTGTYDGYSSKIYIDGKLKNTNAAYTTKTPIYYYASNGIFIGAEATSSATTPGTPYFTGKMSDVRIYATALSADDIAALYGAAGSVANDGTLLTYSFNEKLVDDAKINKDGVFIADTFNERGILNNVKFTTLLSDNSAWGRIFYHNNQSGTVLFTTYDEVMKTDTANKFSCLYLLDQLKATDGKYEFMLTYPSYSTGCNRWKQTNNPCKEYKGTADSTLTATGYSAIQIDFNTNYWGGLTRQNSEETAITSCYLSGSVGHSNWFHAIGATEAWSGAIPGPNVAVQETELWIRLDTLPLNVKMSILNEKSVSAFRFLEI